MKTLRSETIVLFVQCSADPRLLEALRKTENCGGGGWKNGWNAFVCLSLRLKSHSQKAFEKQFFFRGYTLWTCFCFFASSLGQKDCTIFTLHNLTDSYIERLTAHRIKINYHSFDCLPNSKTNLKWKHHWEQGGPLVFRGPTQLVYSAYREHRLWCNGKD